MISEIQSLLEKYSAWLKKKTSLRQLDGWIEITTPYLDRHNDQIQIYAKGSDDGYLLTDDGRTIADLNLSGCSLESQKRQALLKTTLNGFGVQLNGDALEIKASTNNFPLKKHSLLQAVLAVGDLFYLSRSIVTSVFLEDVTGWLDLSAVRYSPKVKFTGISGFDHLFDFVVPKSKKKPERIIRAINNPTKDTAQSLIFAWLDTKETRPPDSQAYAILNDTDRKIPETVTEALNNYGVSAVPWSERDDNISDLAA